MIWFSGDTERPLLKDSVIVTNFSKIKFNEGSMKIQWSLKTTCVIKLKMSKKKFRHQRSKNLLSILSYSDGKNGIFNISKKVKIETEKFNSYIKILKKNNLIKLSDTINF